ncbi:MAG: hypothetical protein HY809_09135 [Nitrospirae bacterium]|nr:hypothetical protein [Nitrospirota bacterium]
MLSNKYFIFAIAALLALVIIYNIKFFSSRNGEKAGRIMPVQAPSANFETAETASGRPIVMSDGNWKRDPFSVTAGASRDYTDNDNVLLSGILKKEGGSLALINGSVFGIGDFVDGGIIKDIKSDSIVISRNGVIKEFYISNTRNSKETKK